MTGIDREMTGNLTECQPLRLPELAQSIRREAPLPFPLHGEQGTVRNGQMQGEKIMQTTPASQPPAFGPRTPRMRQLAQHAYAFAMVPEAMIEWLARAAKQAREDADPPRKIIHIAVAADLDPSTVWRFEQGRWPRDPDKIIAAYANELGIEPREIWVRAIDLWLGDPADEPLEGGVADDLDRRLRSKRQPSEATRHGGQGR